MALQDGDRIVRLRGGINERVPTDDDEQRKEVVQQTINDVVLYLYGIEADMELATTDWARTRAQERRDRKRAALERTLTDRLRDVERRAVVRHQAAQDRDRAWQRGAQ